MTKPPGFLQAPAKIKFFMSSLNVNEAIKKFFWILKFHVYCKSFII